MRFPCRHGRPGGPAQTLSAIALLSAVLVLLSGCATPSLIVVSPILVISVALFNLGAAIFRLSRALYNMTWTDIGRLLARGLTAVYRAVRRVPALVGRSMRRMSDAGPTVVLRRIGKGLLRGAMLVVSGIVVALAAVVIYLVAVVLLVIVEIPFIWLPMLLVAMAVATRAAVSRVVGLAVQTVFTRRARRRTPHDDEPADPDAQFINFRIPALGGQLDTPLVVGQPYVGVIHVGAVHGDNLATGDTTIPRADIPATGLATDWVLWSTTVRLDPDTDPLVAFDVAEAGVDTQWMARFPLVIPDTGDSDERTLRLTPVVEGAARIDGLVRVSGDIYREFTVALRTASGSPGEEPEPEQVPGAGPAPAGTVDVPEPVPPAVVATELLVVPADELAPPARAPWQHPAHTLQILFLQSIAQSQSVELGPDEAESWRPDIANVESIIGRVRHAANAVRSKYQWAFDSITADSIEGALTSFRPSADWTRETSVPERAEQQWDAMARSPELAQLAYEGYALHRAIFPDGSRMADFLKLLEPGDRLDLTWQQNGGSWVSHVPWTLLYGAEPPADGDPVEATEFFGLRYRIGYRAYSMGVRSRTITDAATRAHLMYWGGQSGDETWAAARQHATALARWQPLLLPTAVPGKAELQRFLRDPAPRPVGLLYFYCHCVAGDGSDPVLRFGSTNDAANTLGLIDLGTRQLPDQPLVFANACDSVVGEPYTPNRLERLFFDRKCRAFIGTECKVPIHYAARFADVFFTFLYGTEFGPTSAGEALVQTRRFFWTEYRNIGGLFYSYVNDYHVYLSSTGAGSAVPVLAHLQR